MRNRIHLITILVTIFLALDVSGLSLIPFNLTDLVAVSQVAGVFDVLVVRDEGSVISYTLIPVDVWIGSAARPLEVSLSKHEPAMPIFQVGKRYVLFLRPQNRFEKVIGFRWGALRVEKEQLLDMEDKEVLSTSLHFSPGSTGPDRQLKAATAGVDSAPQRLDLAALKLRVQRLVELSQRGK